MTRPRLVEPTPTWARCRRLNQRCGAKAVRTQWRDLDTWHPALLSALDLPEFDARHPCRGCPILATEAVAA
jgi:hypothetical protein